MPAKKTGMLRSLILFHFVVRFTDVVRRVEMMEAMEKEDESLSPRSKPLDVKKIHTPMHDIEEEILFSKLNLSFPLSFTTPL